MNQEKKSINFNCCRNSLVDAKLSRIILEVFYMFKEIRSEKDIITSADLFKEIIEAVKNAGKWPDIIDYALPYDEVYLYDYEFDPIFILKPGGSEGYYLDLGIRGCYSQTEKVDLLGIGTIKTLCEDPEGVRKMAALYGECLIAYEKIVSDNLDLLNRKGFDLYFVNAKVENIGGYSGYTTEAEALEKFRKQKEQDPVRYAKAIIRNNLTRKEQSYE